MKRRDTYALLLSIFVLVNFAERVSAFSFPDSVLMAGTVKFKITPEKPIPMSGYGNRKEPFKGVHDDIFGRIIVFSDGTNSAALISLELIAVSNDLWQNVTEAIEKKTGLKKEFVLLSAVHNHNGPSINVYNDGNTPDVLAYVKKLKELIVTGTIAAIKNMTPVSMGAGKGECKMNINRRAQNGKGEISLGLNPYGPCDHEVGVVQINEGTGKPLAIMMNWPCHAVVLGPKNYMITGDWPGAASYYVEKEFSDPFIALVTIGASGDINPLYGPHIDFESNSAYAFGKDAIGEDLAKESLRVAKEMKTFTKATISATQRVVSIPGKDEKADISEDALVKIRLSALKIGSIILTGVSGEVFNEISIKMRKQSPYTNTFMITHCNGSSGYLITEAAYAEGGYEVNTTRAKTGAEKAIIENLLEMIDEL